MTPKAADPAVRRALIDAAARVIAAQGSAGLSLRGLAADAGTSTMAIYTHFGGMDGIRRAVRHEGFARLLDRFDAVATTDDALADLILLGWAYYNFALDEPELFRGALLERRLDGRDTWLADQTQDRLAAGVVRCIEVGRLPPIDPALVAAQLWAFVHGVVALQLTGAIGDDIAFAVFASGGANLFRGMGAGHDDLERAVTAARDRADPAPP
jgi:AcrR family transcriptional regulator